MLPAVSADLPAYLLPPKSGSGERLTGDDNDGFGPSVQLDLSSAEAVEAQSRNPGIGLYGPDGQFVETSNRASSGSTPFSGTADQSEQARDLDLAQFDSVIPPAAREELRALADRVARKAEEKAFDSRDFQQIARLMAQVGRFDRANWALTRAKELDSGEENPSEPAAPSVIEATRENMAEPDLREEAGEPR